MRIIDEIARVGLPREFLDANGGVFLEEDFADNAFTYISIQLLRLGIREDGWHTDGGTSLLHAALTLFGHREMLVELEDQVSGEYDTPDGTAELHQPEVLSFQQRPGSFYFGNLCAMKHNVKHGDQAEGCYGPAEKIQIAVMFRTDVFRYARARKINSRPGPRELYDIVNTETARHIAQWPLHLPDLNDVIAEAKGTQDPV